MTPEERKEQIRHRLKLSKYPRRANAVFTDENDHNPLILEECPRCHGTGQVDIYDENTSIYALEVCPDCLETGITGEVVPYFENLSPAMEATKRDDGWTKCPRCGWRFSARDSAVWTGLRHKRCGQKLKFTP